MSKMWIVCVLILPASVAGATWVGAWPASDAATCCQAGADCCYPGSSCCDDCCYPGSPCCYPGSPCCDGSCCADKAACCSAGEACCLATSADLPAAGKVQAGNTPAAVGTTVITVEDMDCPSCAKKIVAKLKAVMGVATVVADTEESRLTVSARDRASPSPKAMWEAVVKAGFKPTKLEGPAGKFTALPKE